METTRLSTKGQIVVPLGIRASRAWAPGTEFSVEETRDGILLRPVGVFVRTQLSEVGGCLRAKGKSKTAIQKKSSQMDEAVRREVIRRRDRGRY